MKLEVEANSSSIFHLRSLISNFLAFIILLYYANPDSIPYAQYDSNTNFYTLLIYLQK
jgi:hypothetical protein